MCLTAKRLLGQSSQPDGSEGTSSKSSNRQPNESRTINFNEEYAKAFRSESYHEVWSQIHSLSGNLGEGNGHSTCSSRLPSYRLLEDNLLEPDPKTVKKILQSTDRSHNNYVNLVSDYFDKSAEAFKLCVLLLQNIEKARQSHRGIEKVLDVTPAVGEFTDIQYDLVIREFLLFVDSVNPFSPPTLQCYQVIHQHYHDLQKKLESNRQLKLDAAIKGTYIVDKDLDTLSRVVTRLQGVVENNRDMVRLCLDRKDDKHPVQEVVRELRKNVDSFNLQLDELEKDVCFCILIVNRARSRVAQEIYPYVPNNSYR